jgi:arylsulfatase A-like enzyme
MIKEGSINNEMVQNIDLAPTILETAGAEVPAEMQGLSMIPLLRGKDTDWRDELYYHYYEYPGIHMVKRHYGIRTDRYKLIHFYYDIDEWELYDLEIDPDEMNNVYEDAAYSEIREELHQRLTKLRAYYQDSEELDQEFLEKDLARLKAMGWN